MQEKQTKKRTFTIHKTTKRTKIFGKYIGKRIYDKRANDTIGFKIFGNVRAYKAKAELQLFAQTKRKHNRLYR